MKNKFLSKVSSFLLGAITLINASLPIASAMEENPFRSDDLLRQKIIASSSGEKNEAISKNHRVMGESGRFIVTFEESASLSRIKNGLSGYCYRLLAKSEERVFLVYIDDEATFLQKNADIIAFFEKDEEKSLAAITPNDTYSGVYELEMINMPTAWEQSFGEKEIIVAITDSGVFRDHEDLKDANILPGFDFGEGKSIVNTDSTGHGTKVSGIISATVNNAKGCCGVAPNCTLLPLKIANDDGRIYTSDFIDSVYLAADSGANVINMSLGGYEYSESEAAAIKYANDKGCILVAAAGNEGNDEEYSGMKSYPASYDGVISVGAVDELGKGCIFSQHNDAVDISAPGKNLSLLENTGGYTIDSGTSFATAYISGAAALALSVLDDGIKMSSDQFDYLISVCASGISNDRTGAGILDMAKTLENVNYPLVSGIMPGGIYYDNVAITYNRGTATLDGEIFKSGSLCKHTGEHILTVTDGTKVTEIKFSTDNLPLSCTLKEGEGYSYITFPVGNATLDGIPYISGEKITTDGEHVLVLTGIYGNTKKYTFNLSFSKPVIHGVEDGKSYNHPVGISIAGGRKIYLNGKEKDNNFTVHEEGTHTLVIKQNGNKETSLKFTVSYDKKILNTSVGNGKALEGFGVIIVWNSSTKGIRLYDSETLSLIKYINMGEVITDVYLGENGFYISGRNNVYFIDGATIKENSTVSKIYTFDFPVYASHFNSGALYYAESSVSRSGAIKKLSLSTLEKSEVCFIRDIPNHISYDPYTDSIAFGTEYEAEIYISPISGGSISLVTPFETLSDGFIFRNGKIACGGQIFSVEKNELVFSVPHEKALYFDGVTLITEKGIYNTETYENKGTHSINLTSVNFSNGKYLAMFNDVFLYISEVLPTAVSFEISGKTSERNDFKKHIYLSSEISHVQKAGNNLFAVTDDNILYILNEKDLSVEGYVFLPFVPSGLETDGINIYAYSKSIKKIAVYNQEKQTLSYISTPCFVWDLSVNDNYIAFICDTALYISNKQGEILSSQTDDEFISLALSQDGKNIYVTHYRSFYRVLTSYFIPDFTVEYEVILNYEATDMFCDNTYLYINTAAHYTRNGTVAASASSKIYGRTSATFLTATGLFSEGKYISTSNQKGNEFLLTESGTLYLFDGNDVYITENNFDDYNLTPEIKGFEDGGEYTETVTIEFSRGNAYLDGIKIESGATVSSGGIHEVTIILPYGLTYKYTFKIDASLSEIRIKGGDTAIKVNDTVKFQVEFLPTGAPKTDIMFYCDSDIIATKLDGTVTGIKPGEATLYAATYDGILVTSIKVIVLSSMLVFTPTYYGVDRTNGILYGVPSGTTVDGLIKSLETELQPNAVVYNGEEKASGIVKTGMRISLINKSGDVLDSLLISVIGDCNGDGDVDIGDLIRACELMNQPDAEMVYIKSADFSNTGIVDVADTFTYKEIILGNELTIDVANTEKPQLSANVSFDICENQDGTLTLCLKIEGAATKGISGKIYYDSENLTFLSEEKSGYINATKDKDGVLNFLVTYTEEKEGEVCKLTFSPKTAGKFTFDGKDIKVVSDTIVKKALDFSASYDLFSEEATDVLGSLTPSCGKLFPEFSGNVFSYALKIPHGTKKVDFSSIFGEQFEVQGNENLKDGSVITVIYKNNKYKITVITEQTSENSPQKENSFPIWLAIVLTSSSVAVIFLIFFGKNIKNRFFKAEDDNLKKST